MTSSNEALEDFEVAQTVAAEAEVGVAVRRSCLLGEFGRADVPADEAPQQEHVAQCVLVNPDAPHRVHARELAQACAPHASLACLGLHGRPAWVPGKGHLAVGFPSEAPGEGQIGEVCAVVVADRPPALTEGKHDLAVARLELEELAQIELGRQLGYLPVRLLIAGLRGAPEEQRLTLHKAHLGEEQGRYGND